MARVTVEDLVFSYPDSPDKIILDHINGEAKSGEFVCVLGESGCGKSTFLKLLAGLQEPTEGAIYIDGELHRGPGLQKGVVFQDYGLFPWMSTLDNIIIALEQKYPDKPQSELKEIAEQALTAVDIKEDAFDKFPKALSGGMKQRTAIARAFVIDSPILLMDEPFAALDAITRTMLQETVLGLWSKDEVRKTVFFVTHDIDEALLLATRILVFSQSPAQIIFDRDLDPERPRDKTKLYEDPEMVKLQSEIVQVINSDTASRAVAL